MEQKAFHAYDIRGIYGVEFDKETVYKVGFFLPELLGADKVLVGRDCRVSSDEIHEYLLKGITDAGADVYDAGLCSTPMVYFGTANYGFDASVQITASHNAAKYNGLKVSRAEALPVGFDSGLGQIKQWIVEGRETIPSAKKGQVFQKEIIKDYFRFMESFKVDIQGVNAVMDLSNGMANMFAKDMFGDAPVYLNDNLDGTFPNHEPNPLLPSCQEMLKAAVKENKADIGVIFDGDADRVMFIDENAEFISPDLIIALLGRYFVDEKGEKGVVLQDIRSSKAVGEYLEPKGCQMATWRVGRAYAAPRLRELGGVWGGELAGHYYFRDFFYSDSALLASMLVLHIVSQLKKEGSSISEAINSIAKYKNSGEINFKVEEKLAAMEAVKEMFMSEDKATKFMDFDGYRVEFEDWWFNIRPSNTEPYLRFLCEASSDALLDEKIKKTSDFLEERFAAKRV